MYLPHSFKKPLLNILKPIKVYGFYERTRQTHINMHNKLFYDANCFCCFI